MKRGTARRSSLFLLELLIAILFFSLASAVCIQLFVKAHVQTQDTRILNMAMNQAQNAAEGIRGTDGSLLAVSGLFPTSEKTEDTCTVFYDSQWNTCDKPNASYQMQITLLETSSMIQGQIEILDSGKQSTLYTLDVQKHIPNIR